MSEGAKYILKKRDEEIKRLKEQIKGYGKIVELYQAYVVYLIDVEHKRHAEIDKAVLGEYIDNPERFKLHLQSDQDKYVIDVEKK